MIISELERREFLRWQKQYDISEYVRGKTFLLTGSKGIIGSGLIKWLLLLNEEKKSNVHIIASTRNPSETPEYISGSDEIEFCKFGDEKAFCENRKLDFIIHAASPTGNTFHKSHPVESLRVIVDGTEKILELANEKKLSSMVYLSSEEVYGANDSERAITEDFVAAIDSLNPRSCYPLGKKVCELLCINNFLEYGLNVKILRPCCIQGLLQNYGEERVFNEILRCILEDRNLILKSAGLTKKCMVYSLDVLASIFCVLLNGKNGEASGSFPGQPVWGRKDRFRGASAQSGPARVPP